MERRAVAPRVAPGCLRPCLAPGVCVYLTGRALGKQRVVVVSAAFTTLRQRPLGQSAVTSYAWRCTTAGQPLRNQSSQRRKTLEVIWEPHCSVPLGRPCPACLERKRPRVRLRAVHLATASRNAAPVGRPEFGSPRRVCSGSTARVT